jgi:hypothetical protein
MPIDPLDDSPHARMERERRRRLPFVEEGCEGSLQAPPKLHILVMVDAYFVANDEQGKILKQALRIFDRQMKDAVAIHIPYNNEEDNFNQAICNKKWSDDQLLEIRKDSRVTFR